MACTSEETKQRLEKTINFICLLKEKRDAAKIHFGDIAQFPVRKLWLLSLSNQNQSNNNFNSLDSHTVNSQLNISI